MANIEKRKTANDEVKTEKMYKGLHMEFCNIAHIRMANGLDKKYSPIRVQKKVLKHGLWNTIKEDLKIANFLDDERAQAFSIFYFIVVAFVTVVLFGGLIYAHGLIYDVLHDVGIQNDQNSNPAQMGYTNLTYAADLTFGTVNNSIQALRMVALVYILGLAVVIIITNALVKMHPLWFFAYILICALAVLFSVPIANAYDNLLSSGIYDNGLQSFTASNWILLNLPMFTFLVSVIGSVFLFINIVRTGNEGSVLG